MGVYIKGMEMPENCQDCTFCDFETDYEDGGYYVCHAIPKQILPTYSERQDDCPLVPVPPHGRLIDIDAPYQIQVHVDGLTKKGGIDIYAPAVLEADPAEEGE